MKRVLMIGLVAVLAGIAPGCASRYNVTYSSGTVVTARGRPKLDKATGYYTFQDVRGNQVVVPALKIRSIEIR